MKLVSYRCEDCETEKEELFNDSETPVDQLDEVCECGGRLLKYNYKRNCHRVYIQDSGGV